MQPVLVERADIKTCCIEVRVVKIDRKQMTIAVFKQIPDRLIADPETLELRGTPWGLIHHNGVYVLWQQDDTLRKCTLSSFDLNRLIRANNWCSDRLSEGECRILDNGTSAGTMHNEVRTRAYVAKLAALHKSFAALDQLFIAV